MPRLDEDRLLPLEERPRAIARALYRDVADLPIISPHGHTDPRWFAANEPFTDPASLLVTPDHYVLRMLVSAGIPLADLGVARSDGVPVEDDPRRIWHRFADNYHLFRGTPSAFWLDHTLATLFGIEEPLGRSTGEAIFERISECLADPAYRPRALFERFRVEVLATTEGALDPLDHHRALGASGWAGRVVTTYRPDAVVDPDTPGFPGNIRALGELTGRDVGCFQGYLDAHRDRRAYFREVGGATATDHGHPSARTEDLGPAEAEALYARVLSGRHTPAEAEAFRGQMLTEMARMSLEDGMVMQLHAGAARGHHPGMLALHGRDIGFDVPSPTEYVRALRPLLSAVGMEPGLTLILFTLDETTYSRELAPLAGVYPCLKLGPPWWFYDSPEGMRRFREATIETTGFYNTVGFNDDTRAFPSIPARHDMARRADCAHLATLVASGRLREDEAAELAPALAYDLAKTAYRL